MKKIRILYHTSTFNPNFSKWDAVGQEIQFLKEKFGGKIFAFGAQNKFTQNIQRVIFKMPFIFEALYFTKAIILDKSADVHHVYYPRLRNLRYLLALKKPIVYSVVSKNMGCKSGREMISMVKDMGHIGWFVCASPEDEKILKKAGIKNVSFLYPGINLTKFKNLSTPKTISHKLIMASAPTSFERFSERGIYLLINVMKKIVNLSVNFLWRGIATEEMKKIIYKNKLDNRAKIIGNRIVDVKREFAKVDGAIAIFTRTAGNKAYPNSIIESLASGRPVIVSSIMPIADYIENKKCGVVVEPNLNSVILGIKTYYKNYQNLAKRAKTAAKIFDQKRLVNDYQEIYQKVA